MRHLIIPSLLLLVPGCGGGGGDSSQSAGIPAPASAMDSKLKSNMTRSLPMVANVESSLVFVLNPGTPMAQGVTVLPDTSPGTAPHSVTFSGPYDGNGDGVNETTVSGRATFNSDPDSGWSGLSGQVVLDVGIPVVGHVYRADLGFTVSSDDRRLSGSGTFADPISGDTTTMTVAASAPLVIKPATGAAGAASNACGYNLAGQMRLDMTGSNGRLTSNWNFFANSASVVVNGASFTDSAGVTTAMPDSTVDLRCGSSGSINDWVATFDQNYACLPRESGQARLTITTTGPDTITIVDEDPPGSGSRNTYQATIIGANPHALRGFFIAGPLGSRYREDFNWSMGKNGSGFSQSSVYTYIEGAMQGSKGVCVATAKRVP